MSSDVVYKSLSFLGFPKYRVGDDGSVWSYRMDRRRKYRWKKLRTKIQLSSANKYKRVRLVHEKRSLLILVHRLVLIAFVGLPPPGMQACHYPNRDGTDNRLTNLMWGTPETNQSHRKQQGTHNSGTLNRNAKLSREQVHEIRVLYAESHGLSNRAFARKHAPRYGVSPETLRTLTAGASYCLD